MMAQFQPVNAKKTARDDLFRLRQTGSVTKYVYDFHTLCLRINDISPSEQMDKFVRGLKRNVQEKVEIEDPQTLKQAMQIAERIDSIAWAAARSKGYDNHSSSSNSYGNRSNGNKYGNKSTKYNVKKEAYAINVEQDPASLSVMNFNERQRCYQDGLCFKCKKPGHMMKACPLNKGKPRWNNNINKLGKGQAH